MTDDRLLEHIDEMTLAECLAFLNGCHVGRIAVTVDDYPVVLPVSYQMVEHASGGPVLIVRTRPGSAVSEAGERVAFEIDSIDAACGVGWSVLVRGIMHHVRSDVFATLLPSADPHPWIDGCDDWLVINPVMVTGRRIVTHADGFGFHPRGYA